MLEKTLESLLDYKEIKTVNPKGNQPWVLIGAIDAEAEAPIFWPPDVKNWLIGKDPDAGKDWRQKEKREPRMKWLGSTTNSMDMNLDELQEMRGAGRPGVLQITGLQRVKHDLVTEQERHSFQLCCFCVWAKLRILSGLDFPYEKWR